MFHFQPTVERVEDEPGPGDPITPADPDAVAAPTEPLRLRLATAEVEAEADPEPEPGSSLDLPELYTYPPERESIELRFSAIRYDLEVRGGKRPGHLKI